MTLNKRLHSLMDRTTVSGTVGAGSIPAGGAKNAHNAFRDSFLDATATICEPQDTLTHLEKSNPWKALFALQGFISRCYSYHLRTAGHVDASRKKQSLEGIILLTWALCSRHPNSRHPNSRHPNSRHPNSRHSNSKTHTKKPPHSVRRPHKL